MSTVSETDKIDLIMIHKEERRVVLIMVEIRPWDVADIFELQEKFKTYLAYVEEGHLTEQFPQAMDLDVVIRLNSLDPPPNLIMKFVEEAKKQWLEPLSIHFEYGVLRWGEGGEEFVRKLKDVDVGAGISPAI